VAFGVASALSPAEAKYLTIVDASNNVDTDGTTDALEMSELEGVAEGRGQMHVRPLSTYETKGSTGGGAGSI